MAAVIPGTNRIILEAVRDRLLEKIPEFTDQNCFLCDQPIPEIVTEGILIITVSPTSSRFPSNFQTGGGYKQIVEEFGVVVAMLSWSELDEAGRESISLVDPIYGVLEAHKPKILRALLYDDDNQRQWRITDNDGNDILRDDITVESSWQPHRHRRNEQYTNWILMGIEFRTVFDWDLKSG